MTSEAQRHRNLARMECGLRAIINHDHEPGCCYYKAPVEECPLCPSAAQIARDTLAACGIAINCKGRPHGKEKSTTARR